MIRFLDGLYDRKDSKDGWNENEEAHQYVLISQCSYCARDEKHLDHSAGELFMLEMLQPAL